MIETLSAPAFSRSRTSWSVRTPPPTVSGMKTLSAVRETTSSRMRRSSWLAVMSRKVISSASCSSYSRATSTGSPASTWSTYLHALHDAAAVDVEARDDALQQHARLLATASARARSTSPV